MSQVVRPMATVADHAIAYAKVGHTLAHGHDLAQTAPSLPYRVVNMLVPPGALWEISAEDRHLGAQVHDRVVVADEELPRPGSCTGASSRRTTIGSGTISVVFIRAATCTCPYNSIVHGRMSVPPARVARPGAP